MYTSSEDKRRNASGDGVGEKKYENMASGFLALLAALEKGNENRRKEKKMMTAEEVRKRIEELSEPSYQQFSARLIPNVKQSGFAV